MSRVLSFIAPSLPTLRPSPPAGARWSHEVKFDGYRAQAHRSRDGAVNGFSFNGRFEGLALAFRELPARRAIIDGEIVAVTAAELPAFRTLHLHAAAPEAIRFWAFDLLHLDGKDLREMPLQRRREKLQALIARFDYPVVRFSESFEDAAALLGACEERGIEGVVSKRIDAPYRSGRCAEWVKVKTATWRAANRKRHKLFAR